VIHAPLALYFATGMVATVNPCGFAMLPAYLSYFLGVEDPKAPDARASISRAFVVAASVAVGFLAVFSIIGFAIESLSLSVYRYMPWVSIVIGVALVVLGVALLRGFELTASLPRLRAGGRSRGIGSMVLFGASYATVSIGCTLPNFIIAVSGTFKRANLVSGLAVFAAYALGMALVLLGLTVALALARQSLVRTLRRSGRHINRVAGGLMVVAGAYVAYYGAYELRVYRGRTSGSGPVDVVTGWSTDISAWVQRTGSVRIGVVLAMGLAVVAFVTFGVRARRTSAR
jgi:cytochrome c-type biogenesis protein